MFSPLKFSVKEELQVRDAFIAGLKLGFLTFDISVGKALFVVGPRSMKFSVRRGAANLRFLVKLRRVAGLFFWWYGSVFIFGDIICEKCVDLRSSKGVGATGIKG